MKCAGSSGERAHVAWSDTMVGNVSRCVRQIAPSFSRADVAQSPFWDSQIIGAADAQTHRVLGQALARAQAGGFDSAECATTQGTDIAAAICGYAEHLEADLIVVGSVGLTGLARLVLGSVAQDVAAKAYCPVTIVR